MSLFAAIEKSKSKISSSPLSSPLSASASPSNLITPKSSPYKEIEKQSAKKKQSSLKGYVHTFVKLIISLRGDMEQILLLLQNLVEIYTLSVSIYTITIKDINDNKIAIGNSDNGQSVKYIYLQNKITVLDTFPDIGPKILAKILIDIDSLNLQIYQFMRSIGDYLAAMKLCSHDVMNCVIDEHPQMFTEQGTIFTTEHALNIQEIASQYEQEYDRMKTMISLIKVDEKKDTKYNMPDNMQHWKSSLEDITQTYENWGEESKSSCLDSEFIDLFVLTNGGGEQ